MLASLVEVAQTHEQREKSLRKVCRWLESVAGIFFSRSDENSSDVVEADTVTVVQMAKGTMNWHRMGVYGRTPVLNQNWEELATSGCTIRADRHADSDRPIAESDRRRVPWVSMHLLGTL